MDGSLGAMHVPEVDAEKMSDKAEEKNESKPTKEQIAEVKSDESHISKEKHSSKDNYYIKKRIIAAINRSFKSNNNSIQHTFAVSDDDKNDVKNRQSITIIVKRIDLDKESILYTQEKGIPEIINLETFKVKEISAQDDPKHNSHHSSDKKRQSDDRSHRSSDKRHSDSHRSSDKKRPDDSRRSEKKYRFSDETLKRPYLLCHSCGRKEEKKWVHENCKNKCCRSTAFLCDSCLKHKIVRNDYCNDLVRGVNFGKYMYVIKCPNGRGCSLHMDYERIMHLRSSEQRELATEFLKQAFLEDDKGFAQFTIAIVHNGAKYMPDILKLLAKTYPTLKVNTTKLKSSTETELTDLLSYYKKVKETYNNGTFAHDPLNETQAACVKNADEYGAYLPEMLSLLEKSPFLSQVLPWGEMTTKRFNTPHESDDGPIFWCRPGEQIVSLDRNSQRSRWNTSEIESFLSERKKNMNVSEKKLIVEELKKYRRSNSAREFLFEDRTRPHADQAWGNSFEATAAVGVIQAIHPDENPDFNRTCKEIVVFQAKHIEILEALLHIDFTAAPKQQCAEWLDDAKLNMIRQMKIEFSKLHLRDNDIYFIPRKIVHQFKTISATLSIAWHTRLRDYYKDLDETISKPLNNGSTTEEATPKKKPLTSRSRSVSFESRNCQNNKHPKKRKHKSHRSRSSSKKPKKEPRSNSVVDEKTANPTPLDTECPSDAIKSEPLDESTNNVSSVEKPEIENNADEKNTISLLCPRVEIVDIKDQLQSDGILKCGYDLPVKMNDAETESIDRTSENISRTDLKEREGCAD